MSFFLKKFTAPPFFKKFSLSFLLLVTTFSFSLVFAATYYIDSVGGSDPIVSAVLNGPVSWTVSGKYDKALVFDGGLSGNSTTYVSLDSNPLFKPAHFTFSSWIFASSTATEQSIFKPAYSDGWSSGFSLFLEADGSLTFRYGDGTSSRGSFSTSGTDYRNSWHFVAVSFNGSVSTLYVDGIDVASSSLPGFAYSGISNNVWIGGSNGMHSFKGMLDDIRFYGRNLSSFEILDLYNNTNVSTSSLIFYLPFNEGVGIKTVDVSHNDGSISFPWKTLEQVSHFNFEPNDSILLKRGSSWNETLTVPSSGEKDNPITFGAYGTGAKPVITGSTVIAPSNWVPCGITCNDPHIYVASTTLVNEEIISLFSDNQKYSIAHYPDTEANPYITVTNTSLTNDYIVSTNFNPPSLDFANANVYLRSNPWTIENKKISSYDDITHTLYLNENTSSVITKDYGFYVTDKLWMLDHPGEWYYSTSTNNLYVWMLDGANPATHVVEVSPLRDGVIINNKHDVILRDIDIKNTGGNGVTSNSASRIDIEGLDISYADGTGIYFSGNGDTGGIKISSSTINHATLRGINLVGVSTTTDSFLIGNIINNTGMFNLPVMSYSSLETTRTKNVTVKNNIITNSNYIGIRFSGDINKIENNIIDNSCLILDDCAGIYTWGNYGTGNIVKGNIITNSLGNFLGTPYYFTQSEGIYLDDNSNGNIVEGNTMNNTHKGIFVHNSNNNIITDNTMYASRESGLAVQEDSIVPSGVTFGNSILRNIFFNTSSTSPSAKFNSYLGHLNLGTYNNNFYTSSYLGYPLSQKVFSTSTNYSLSDWGISSGQDLLSHDVGTLFSVINSKIISYLASNFIANSTFDATTTPWSIWSSNSLATIAWTPVCGLDGGCIHIVTSSSGSIAISDNFSLLSGVAYEVSFDAISNTPITGTAVVRLASSPWTAYGGESFDSGPTPKHFSFIFTSNVTITDGARLDLETSNADYYIDNISVRPVTFFNNNTADDSVLYTNPTTSSSTITIGDTAYCDLNNNRMPSTFTLTPFTSKILLSCFNNNDRVCNNHETHDTAPLDCPTVTEEGVSAGMDAPFVSNTDKPNVSGTNRIYNDGKFRTIATTTGLVADLVVTPVLGFTGSSTPLLDIVISKWNTSGDYSKTWTESSDTLGSASTSHIIGDLKSSTSYIIKRDGVNYATSTTASNGKLSFIYGGGYSTHTFDIIENPIQPIGDSCGSQANTIQSIKPTGINACSSGTLNASSLADTASSWGWTCGSLSCTASKAGCSTVTDTNYVGPIPANTNNCALTCLNGGSNYPTCTPPVVVVVTPPTQPSTFSSGGGSGWYTSFYPTQQVSVPVTSNPVQVPSSVVTVTRPSVVTPSLPVTDQNTAISKTCTYYFEKDLVYHDDNEDVRDLQKFLNSDPRTIVRRTGNGSPGKEITYYGISTYFAVMKYQLLHLKEMNAKVPSGAFLSKTRGVVNRGCE